MDYGSYYGTLASYFGQSGGTGSPGKAGGAGYSNDMSYGAGSSSGDTQQPSASSGSGWISAAASTASEDKSSFSNPFMQGFGGIANNQTYIIGSPGATSYSSPSLSPVTAPPTVTAAPVVGAGGNSNLLLVAALVVAAVLLMR